MNYALITGASSGIGRCYAREMASRGYNIIAVSNQEVELQHVAKELNEEFGVEVITLFANLAERDAAKRIFDICQAEHREVEILICNAGMLLFSTLVKTDP